MHALFVHPNFPAQFRYVAPRLARTAGWRCSFVTLNANAPDVHGVERILYRRNRCAGTSNHPCTRSFETAISHAHGVYESLKTRPDIKPDLVVAHSGFGSSLFLPHLYDAPVINFFEYFFRPVGQNLGYRPELGLSEEEVLRSRTTNAMVLLDLDNCDRGWCPNVAQRDVLPKEYHPKLEVIPEGVDTALYRRREWPERRLPDGTPIPPGTRVVTYVSRGFELTRGFDIFLHVARKICQDVPDVLFVVVGTDKPHYGADKRLTADRTLRAAMLEGGAYDLSRFKFTGWVSEQSLVDILSVSDLHIYLTVPFVTSWSMLDAMSCSCVVLASDQACTREYITHERNGLLCDFFDVDGIAKQAVRVLRDPGAYRGLGAAARLTIEEVYSLDVNLPRLKSFLEGVASTPRQPSVRAELLVREPHGLAVAGRAEPETAPSETPLPPFGGAFPYHPDSPVGESRTAADENGPRTGPAAGGKTVLFAWEVGAGLGHLMQIRPLVEDLAAAGHCVVVALRHLERAVDAFGHAGVFYLQAPYRSAGPPCFRRAAGYAQHLANLGFGSENGLFALACAWRNLIRTVGPDLIVFDYAPTALLASRAFPVRRVLIGSGFCVPPDDAGGDGAVGDSQVWAALRPAVAAAKPAPCRAAEAEVLQRVNWVLRNWGEPPLGRLAELYADADEQFLTTWPELDHFQGRSGAGYWGPVPGPVGDGTEPPPEWPAGDGKRVFVYLKPTPDVHDVLGVLARSRCPTLAFIEGVNPPARRRLEATNVRIAARRLDLRRVGRECDLAVTNGGHGVTAEMLLSGKPLMVVPLALEQEQTARAVQRIGAGLWAPAREPYAITARLEAVLGGAGDPCAEAARRFSERYSAFDPARQRRAMFDRVTALLAAEGSDRAGFPHAALVAN